MNRKNRFIRGVVPPEDQGHIGAFNCWSLGFHRYTDSRSMLLVLGSEVCVDHGRIVLDFFGRTGRNLAAEI